MDTKTLTAAGEVKADEDTGSVSAVFATFDVPDLQDDVLRAGSIGRQEVPMVWHHDWHRPIGKGHTIEADGGARFDGEFFLQTTAGRDAFEAVKAMGSLQEWSFGLVVAPDAVTWLDAGDRQLRQVSARPDGSPGIEVIEVSPVLKGAGVNTRTLALKTVEEYGDAVVVTAPDGTTHVYAWKDGRLLRRSRLVEHVDDTAACVRDVTQRLADVVAKRAEKDRALGADTATAVTGLLAALADASEALTGLLDTGQDEPVDSKAIWDEFLLVEARRQGWGQHGTLPH